MFIPSVSVNVFSQSRRGCKNGIWYRASSYPQCGGAARGAGPNFFVGGLYGYVFRNISSLPFSKGLLQH